MQFNCIKKITFTSVKYELFTQPCACGYYMSAWKINPMSSILVKCSIASKRILQAHSFYENRYHKKKAERIPPLRRRQWRSEKTMSRTLNCTFIAERRLVRCFALSYILWCDKRSFRLHLSIYLMEYFIFLTANHFSFCIINRINQLSSITNTPRQSHAHKYFLIILPL